MLVTLRGAGWRLLRQWQELEYGYAMKLVLKIVLGLVLGLVVVAAAVYLWASYKDRVLLTRTIETHRVDFPIPFPLADPEADQVRVAREAAKQSSPSDAELRALALQKAIARGQHLLEARYACRECHGKNLGGGTMVNDKMIGTLLGPNLTTGRGSRTLSYTPADWDRAVRHGVKPDGTPSLMPAEEFRNMSDQELSDIVSYIRSLPPVDADVPRPKTGPLGTVLLAVGKIRLAADAIPNSQAGPRRRAAASGGERVVRRTPGRHLLRMPWSQFQRRSDCGRRSPPGRQPPT